MKRVATKKTLLVVLGILFFAPALSARAAPADGAIVKTDGDPKVYYVEAGTKRWIESARAFDVQGFSWAEIETVPAAEIEALPDGPTVDILSRVIRPDEVARLPDLAPFGIRDVYMRHRDGRTELVFAAAFWNRGRAEFSMVATSEEGEETHLTRVAQRLHAADGSVRLKELGSILWHDLHDHYHYGDFGEYIFEPAVNGGDEAPTTRNKTTFCMFDTEPVNDIEPEGEREPRRFSGCGRTLQGVSVGWSDIYYNDLPDQNIDVTGLPAGLYAFTFIVDPKELFIEGRYDNNRSVVLLDIDPEHLNAEVVFSGAPFETPRNVYPDGLVMRGDVTAAVYIIENGKKKPYSPRADEYVHTFPQSVVSAIPSPHLIKAPDSPKVYVINAFGFRRHVPNFEAFLSYGWSPSDITVMDRSAVESYPETDLIRLSGSDDIFSVSDRRFIGRHSDLPGLGHEPSSVHVVNKTDFEAHAIETVAEGLEIPWDIAFLPGGDMLVTERPGRLRRIGSRQASIDLPAAVQAGEGGLMGIALHPDFASNQLLYLYYTDAERMNRIQRFRLDGDRLVEDKLIIGDIPGAIYHDGGQMAFGPDDMLYITTGDATRPELAQDISSLAGKTLRLTAEGDIPPDNPFGTAVWSYGHRNPQGLAWDDSGRLWQSEHGRSGALSGMDELNLIIKGKNYGWPDIEGDAFKEGMTRPQAHSGPDVTWAPASLAYLNGSLYYGGLRGASLYQAVLGDAGSIAGIRAHLSGRVGRLRAVVTGPDEALYVTTSNRDGRGTVRPGDDRILKIYPELLRAL